MKLFNKEIQHWRAILFFGLTLSFYVALTTHPLDSTNPQNELIMHAVTTLCVVAFVHLLDRLWLARDIRGELQEVKTDLAKKLDAVVNAASSLDAMSRSGIQKLFTNRLEAGNELLRSVHDKRVTRIDLLGISLRDFLRSNGKLHGVWRGILERLDSERFLDDEKRLKVRLLLLHPHSSEGRFRHKLEEPTIGPTGIPTDVPEGLSTVLRERRRLFNKKRDDREQSEEPLENTCLEIRLYEHCPFAFMFTTRDDVFVEQYDYKDHKDDVFLPMVQFGRNSPQGEELAASLSKIWENAIHVSNEELHSTPGTAQALEECGIRNIFQKKDRSILGVGVKGKLCRTPAPRGCGNPRSLRISTAAIKLR